MCSNRQKAKRLSELFDTVYQRRSGFMGFGAARLEKLGRLFRVY